MVCSSFCLAAPALALAAGAMSLAAFYLVRPTDIFFFRAFARVIFLCSPWSGRYATGACSALVARRAYWVGHHSSSVLIRQERVKTAHANETPLVQIVRNGDGQSV
ncbi:hypothetical protein IWZ00DRAFT_312323 [Phyllosticta capitalensis]